MVLEFDDGERAAFDVLVVSEDEDGHATRVTMLRAAVGPDALLLDLDANGDKAAIRGAIDVLEMGLPDPEAVRWCFVYAARDGERARRLAESAVERRALEGVASGIGFAEVELPWGPSVADRASLVVPEGLATRRRHSA